MKKQLGTIIIAAALTAISNAAITIRTSNLVAFDNTTSAIVDSNGTVIAANSGFVGIGTFTGLSDSQIQGLDASGIASSFGTVASTNFNTGDGLWDAVLTNNGDTSSFAGQNAFTVLGNQATLAASTEFLIYRHNNLNSNTGTFLEAPSSNTDAVTAVGAASTGTLLVGEHNNFTHDFGAGEVAAFNLVEVAAIPEPSSTALLGLGSVALLLRRRR